MPSRCLAITAHPDDVDFGAAGTVATWTAAGDEVVYCVVTDGDAGGFDPSVPRDAMPGVRRAEQRAAAELVGVHEVEFLGRRDGQVVADLDLRRDLARVIRRVRPDRVLCSSPERDYSRLPASHPDHLAVGEAAFCAIYPDARNPFAFPELLEEGLEPHTVNEIWVMASARADTVIDITDVLDTKIAAVLAHASQLPDPAAAVERVRGWTAATAADAGMAAGSAAERFLVVRL